MSKIPNFKVWTYMADDHIKSYDHRKKTFEVTIKPPSLINSFYVTAGFMMMMNNGNNCFQKRNEERIALIKENKFESFIEDLMIAYCDKLIEDRNQILDYPELKLNFDYFDNNMKRSTDGAIYYRHHGTNVINFFKRLCRNIDRTFKFANFDPIDAHEYGSWFVKCNNAGLLYLRKTGLHKNCYGYDFSMSYPTDMAKKDFQIPTTKGRECIITEFEKVNLVVKYGIYRVQISCDHPDFQQVFAFSKDHYYTHWSVQYALSYQKKFGVRIGLVMDGHPNARVYDHLISGMTLFGNWYNRLKDMKRDLKGNLLVKCLSTSAWGYINQVDTIYKTAKEYEEMADEGYTFSINYHECNDYDYIIKDRKSIGEDFERYELLDTSKSVYKIPIRLLPFITSFSRYKMAKLITKNDLFKSVLRIQTDSITFNKPLTIEIPGFLPEAKTTGSIYFKHVNEYEEFEEFL